VRSLVAMHGGSELMMTSPAVHRIGTALQSFGPMHCGAAVVGTSVRFVLHLSAPTDVVVVPARGGDKLAGGCGGSREASREAGWVACGSERDDGIQCAGGTRLCSSAQSMASQLSRRELRARARGNDWAPGVSSPPSYPPASPAPPLQQPQPCLSPAATECLPSPALPTGFPTGVRVLIADDQATNRRLLEHVLTRLSAGWIISAASSAEEVLVRLGIRPSQVYPTRPSPAEASSQHEAAAVMAPPAAEQFDLLILDNHFECHTADHHLLGQR